MKPKTYRIESSSQEGIKWKIIRTNHPTRGDYLVAEFFDRGAIQLFIQALEANGFQEEKERV